LDAGDLEGLAEALHLEAGLDPSDPAGVAKVARGLWRDAGAVELVPRDALRHVPAKLALVQTRWRIYVRSGTPREQVGFLIGHELAHWALRREGVSFELEVDEERACDYLGACLVAPRSAFRATMRALGEDVRELAERFGSTETLAVLRWGETTGRDLAVVRPGLVRVRGQLSFVWPDEQTIRSWTSGRVPKGLARTRLDGDRRRHVLVVDEDLDAA
jgi:hypothetical protein